MRKILNIESWINSPKFEIIQEDMLTGIYIVRRLKDGAIFTKEELVIIKKDCHVWQIIGFFSNHFQVYAKSVTDREGVDAILSVDELIKF